MELNGFLSVFGVACFGGALLELYKWYRLRESPRFPRYATSPVYWIVTVLMVLAGGFLATLYGTESVQAALAANIGLSAPAAIRALSGKVPEEVAATQEPQRRRRTQQHDVDNRLRWSSIRAFMAGA